MANLLRVGQCCLQGPVRQDNEDAVLVTQLSHMTLAIVADGRGGSGAGNLASQLAVRTLLRELKCRLSPLADQDQARQVIRAALTRAHEAVSALSAAQGENRYCGSTVVVAVWRKDDELYLTHRGDSRAYRRRAHHLEQLTVDDDLTQALIRAGTINAADVPMHRITNALLQFLGSEVAGEEPEIQLLTPRPGDLFLLCTDGLSNYMPIDELLFRLQEQPSDVSTLAAALGQSAIAQGSRDNVSCVVMEFAEGPPRANVMTPVEPSWLTWNDGCVVKLASTIRDEGCFERLPILADALEEAGCASVDLLTHCREPGEHIPGCWAVESLLTAADDISFIRG